ncbi:MAG: hypothetical protein VX494_12685 [Actinomycetota bacterium]|nr:hypothetical protein [Actinomycetota bacterium]
MAGQGSAALALLLDLDRHLRGDHVRDGLGAGNGEPVGDLAPLALLGEGDDDPVTLDGQGPQRLPVDAVAGALELDVGETGLVDGDGVRVAVVVQDAVQRPLDGCVVELSP